MGDGEVFRRESKRWVAPHNSYDGDDWGEYDEYDDYSEHGEYGEEPKEPKASLPSVHGAPNLKSIGEEDDGAPSEQQLSQPAPAPAPAPKPATTQRRMSQKRKEVPSAVQPQIKPLKEESELPVETIAPLSHSKSNSVASASSFPPPTDETSGAAASRALEQAANDPHELGRSDDADHQEQLEEESGGSLQDIYGFYESRYPQHPYSAMAAGGSGGGGSPNHTEDYSDSTASLSTGRRSLESGLQDSTYSSSSAARSEKPAPTDYQSGLDQVPEGEEAREPATPRRGGDAPQYASDVGESPFVVHTVERLHIAKSADATLDGDSPERPISHIDPDIAEMYQGTSAFLNRPISTYQSQPLSMREISDASIRELLTPQAAQNEFEASPSSGVPEGGVPSLLVTEASPERTATRTVTRSSDGTSTTASRAETSQESFANDHDYVDAAGESDNDGDASSSDNDVMSLDNYVSPDAVGSDTTERRFGTADGDEKNERTESVSDREPPSLAKYEAEPFILPSERNRLQPSLSATSDAAEPDSAGVSVTASAMSEDTRDSAATDAGSRHKRGESQTSGTSAATGATGVTSETGATDSAASDIGARDSDVASPSNFALAAASSDTMDAPTKEVPPAIESAEGRLAQDNVLQDNVLHDNALHDNVPGPQSVAAKVKRPPLVDFTALLNNSGGSSESRCEQLRLLRTREAEYSSGLETWLTTTYAQIDMNVKVYTNGIPDTTQPIPSHYHDTTATIATAKMSSVVHSSATNTKEKLGKVGNKSKSFFAKVMR